ncbi:MAG: radical SAM protein [Candidatus Lokiarchaeia archaeon]
MNILLINSWEKDCGTKNFLSPPMGLWRIEAFLRNKMDEVKVDIFDPNLHIDVFQEFSKLLNNKKFDIIGFSPLHFTLDYDISLMYFCVQNSPESLFIAGGQEATFNSKFLFKNFSELNLIIAGEGEKPLKKLVEVLKKHPIEEVKRNVDLLKQIEGLFLRDSNILTKPNLPMDYELFKEVTMLTNFDVIPQKEYWDLISSYYTEEELKDNELKKKILVLKPFTSNYCPYNCVFCSSTNFQSFAAKAPVRSISLKTEDMEIYLRELLKNQPKAKTILFKDDNFFDRGNKDNVDMLKMFIKLGKEFPSLSFATKTRIDTFIREPELIGLLKKANFFFVSLGVESFSQKELKYMNKGVSPEDNKKVLRELNKAGIKSIIYIILSTLVTLVEDIFLTIDSCIEFIERGDVVKVFPYMIPIKGSTLGEDTSLKGFTFYDEKKIPLTEKKIKITQKIVPKDRKARELLEEFEKRYQFKEQEYKKKLITKHFTAEISTPIKFLTLYELAKEKKFLDEKKCNNMISRIKKIVKI